MPGTGNGVSGRRSAGSVNPEYGVLTLYMPLARISHQAARELEVNSLNLNKVSEIDCFTVCFTPRSFGPGTPRMAPGTFLPASHSPGRCPAVQERTQKPPGRTMIRKPGEKFGLDLGLTNN